MSRTIFVSLPVADLARSRSFYQALGFAQNAGFSDDTTACFVVSETINLMIASHERFQALSPKPLVLPSSGAMSLISLTCDSRAEVDAITDAALTAGGRALHEAEDLGFMYSRAFEDPDGNAFGVLWMDPTAGQG
jgi:hypothetical protein